MRNRGMAASIMGHFLLAATVLTAAPVHAGWLTQNEKVPVAATSSSLGREHLAAELFSLQSCTTTPNAADFPAAPPDYTRKYNTIAHKFLDDERSSNLVTPQMYAVLDGLISEAVKQLAFYPHPLPAGGVKAFAQQQLGKIDCLLLSHGFVYSGKGLVQSLSDGLGPTLYDMPDALRDLKTGQGHNARRIKFIEARGQGPFYVVDCDIASFIYLAVAEVMHYPLYLITIPGHNFVRWVADDGRTYDYETMDGELTDDGYYMRRWLIPSHYAHVAGILDTLDVKKTFAYHNSLNAVTLSWRGKYDDVIKQYMRSIEEDPVASFATNNLAWFYATGPEPYSDGKLAVKYASLAATQFPGNGDILDTLACAYARSGDFTQAVEAADKAAHVGYAPNGGLTLSDRDAVAAHQPCKDPGFGRDPRPFRPHDAYPPIGQMPVAGSQTPAGLGK